MAEESAVKVCVRVRPLIEREETAAESAEPVKFYWKADKKTIHQVDDGNLTKNFSFDRVFSAEETTLQLYQELAKPLVVSTVEGYNGTIFAYGQTSSGKTFTMMGSSLTPGVIPLAMEDVFQTIKNCPKKEFLLRVSYLEIYNETVTDLLCDSWKRKPLEIREGNNKNVYVADLTEELVTSPEQALAWIRKGEKNRHYGKTKMNQRSSRSHTIFRMILESRDRGDSASGENSDCAIIVSHLNLVDLAGTERASQTGAEGTRFKEGCNINRSLFTLGQVIKKLSDETQKGFTNYRDSKLTRILQNSLGGNAKTVIICTITPVTLEETLSTLQFASAAKNMKNDPHVTEVSDDGALLRRYRNEIVELKRRLLEVSSVTQTTATEKETLSQILQEKDQLQREQEDRYKNLTKLLVTSANFVTIKKMPKRRVTWGGKLPSPAFHHAGESDLSFAEPFLKKRKADMSVLTEQNEDGEEFDSTFDMEMNQSNLTVRGFAESEFLSPNQLNKLSEKVSCLELQLENETQQKQEAMEEVETFQRRVVELEKQLEEKSLMPADAQLDNETQQNQEAMEKVATFEMRVAELEKQLENSQMPADAQEQMKRGFEETIQLCETLVSEKEMVATERDYLKKELNIIMEQTEKLKKEKAVLLQEMEEKKEIDEFNSLEEESKREYEKELLNDISSLKKAMEASGRKSQELEANLVAMSEELKKKGDWAEELQRSSDVDLVQQVKQLRRSLDDAEGLSRDTKKEWAHLRSENISLKQRAVTLTAGYERMEAQVNGLRHQLETEKSSFKKMQVDLQRELQGAFEENTKLTTLLDGKVPKNLIDSIELEKTVADLKKELEKSHEDERTLQAKIEDLSALQDLPDKVNSFMKQVCDLTEDLCAVQKERDMLVSAKACSEEEAHQFREHVQSSQEQLVKLQGDLSKAELRENDLTQQCTDITEQLETLRKDLARSSLENSQLLTTVEESSLRLKENEQYRASIEDQLCGMQQVMKELEEKLADCESSKEKYDHLSQEHQDQIRQLSEEVIQVQAELKRQQHLNSEQQSCAQQDDQHQLQIQELRAALETMTEERSQLNSDLQQNMEMVAETQGLLHSIQEELRQQKQVNSDLESQSLQKESLLEQQMRQLSDALESGQAERERLLSEKTDSSQNHAEELEKLRSTVTSLTEERDQLQEILEGIREERNQLKRDLEKNMDMMIENQEELRVALEKIYHQEENMKPTKTANLEELQSQMKQLNEELESVRTERECLLFEKTNSLPNHAEELGKLLSTVTSLTGERDQLQEILEGVREERNQLKRELEDNVEMQHLNSVHQPHREHQETDLRLQMQLEAVKELEERLEAVKEERSQLKTDLQDNVDMMIENQEELREAQEKIKSLQGKIQRLQTQNADVETRLNNRNVPENTSCLGELQNQIRQLNEELKSVRAERERLLSEKTDGSRNHAGELEKLLSTVTSLTEERDQLQEILEGIREERNQLKRDLEDKVEMIIQVHTEPKHQQHLNSEQQTEREHQEAQLQQQLQQLGEELETMTQERCQLKGDLQENLEMAAETQGLLHSIQEELRQQRQVNSDLESQSLQKESLLEQQAKQLNEELESVRAERERLLSEKTDSSQNHAEELEKLLSTVTSLTGERDQLQEILVGILEERNQLKRDLEENVKMIENQEELREALKNMKPMATANLEELQSQMKQLNEELESVRAERERLLSEKTDSSQNHAEELEKLRSTVTSLTGERDQLQEILEGVREERNQHKRDLEGKVEMSIKVQEELKQQQHLNSEQQTEREHQEAQLKQQLQQLGEELETMTQERCQLKGDLQENLEMAAETQGLLHSIQEELRQQRQVNSDLESQSLQKESLLEQQAKQLNEELESVRAERERLLSEKTDSSQNHAEELEKLLSTVTSLTGERDQLQEILEGVREERNQHKRDLEDNVEMSIKVQEELKQQQHLNSEQQTEREHQEAQLKQQLQQLGEELETMTQEQCQLKGDLQENLEMAAETQGLLHSIQEELRQQRQVNSDLESQSLQKESLLEQQIKAKQLNEELESVRAERERLLSEKTDSSQNHAEELEKLRSTVTSLTGERDQLQEILEGTREERNQLKRDLEGKVEMMQQLEEEGTHMRDERAQIQGDLQENMEMVIQVQRTLEQQQRLNSQQQAEHEQHEDKLKQQIKQLEEECKGFKEGQFHFKVEADTSHKMLSDANATISILTEQINNLEQSTSCCTTSAGEGLCSRLEGSMQKLQVSLVRLQLVINGASKPGHGPLVDVTQVEEVMMLKLLPLLPKPTQKIYSNINRSTVQITNTVWDTKVLLKLCAKDYKTHIEALVQNDLAVFEERRLQDLLLCRAQAPSHSVKVVENDLLGVWDERLSELLDRREGYLQKMNSVLKKLEESLAAHPAAVSEELRARERSNEELNALCMVHSPDSAAVENFLERELARRSALAQANTLALQGLRDERCGLLKELGVVRAQADSQLKEERSKTSTLLQILERASVKTEADLLRDNQQLTLKRQQLDGEIKEMQMRVDQLEEDQIKAANSVSNHKQATQLLQTELQDACAQVKDREGSIQVLKEKLRETEVLAKRRASPSALQHEELKAKVLKMELEMTASSSKHQEELLRMTTVLNHKEDALRTLKETLRRSQQEEAESFNEGQDLHARLITARGRTVQSNILLEKNKLEEELKRLQSKISELESLVSTQQGEITKWKARAIKLKEKKRDVVDKPLSPCTPTKHRLPMNSEQFLNSPKRFLDSPKKFLDSPKKFLDSPKKFLDSPKKFLDSPKSKFFDVRPGSESMSINCPKQFFDNSNLGTIQEVAGIPISEIEAAGSAEEDASASVDKKDEFWPLSPKQSDVCKQQ
ncbi:centromere-associated protein E isoform X3 [Oncorhynchus mykiss]|uniref:centromere-associated protein E isoform X3 n=1 Tax=Oncorhynchus mykiss TaxID=8022 RepID=UPI001878FC09|nr:centromere-associated protein E isoform X3 [Oncorhynchus mykiss]